MYSPEQLVMSAQCASMWTRKYVTDKNLKKAAGCNLSSLLPPEIPFLMLSMKKCVHQFILADSFHNSLGIPTDMLFLLEM